MLFTSMLFHLRPNSNLFRFASHLVFVLGPSAPSERERQGDCSSVSCFSIFIIMKNILTINSSNHDVIDSTFALLSC